MVLVHILSGSSEDENEDWMVEARKAVMISLGILDCTANWMVIPFVENPGSRVVGRKIR